MSSWQTDRLFHTGLQTMNQSRQPRRSAILFLLACVVSMVTIDPIDTHAAGGVLTLITSDQGDRQAVPARIELHTNTGRRTAIRRTIASGPGVVLPGTLELPLANGPYRFKIIRGPEYRVVSGQFTIEPGAADERLVPLSRMVDMKAEGYLSGDMAAYFPEPNLRLRMATEDLHVAALVDSISPPARPGAAEPLPATDNELLADDSPAAPMWIIKSATATGDLLVYAPPARAPEQNPDDAATAPTDLSSGDETAASIRPQVALANPFSWQTPIHLASGPVDGIFVLGDWLRESGPVDRFAQISAARPPADLRFRGPQGPGRYAEAIYWQLLEAGLRIAPLAGTGTRTSGPDSGWASSAIGYNRIYAIGPPLVSHDDRRLEPIESADEFFTAVWAGRSMLTNGPLLRPTLGGKAPGHRFQAQSGELLEIAVELHLAVRDPVEYLEVIHNGEVFYSARLDEFAKTGGMIPPLKINSSGWVMVRVVTEHEDHFRAGMSAPWFIDFDDRPRISRKAVEFFGKWLTDCESELKKLPADDLAKHIEPVRVARAFWRQRLSDANAD